MSLPNISLDLLVNGEPLRAIATVSIDPATGQPVAAIDSATIATAATNTIKATNGDVFNADAPAIYARDPDGNIEYIEITDGAAVYRQTWTWTDGFLTATSGWERQS